MEKDEREPTAAEGDVLYEQRVRLSPVELGLLVAGVPAVGAFALAALYADSKDAGTQRLLAAVLAIVCVFAVISMLTRNARVVVSEGELLAQVGSVIRRIAMDQVTAVKLAPSGRREFTIGTNSDLKGNTWLRMNGDHERAVHVEQRHGPRLVVVCEEPEAVMRALDAALARHESRGREAG